MTLRGAVVVFALSFLIALNMQMHVLAADLRERGIAVALVLPW